MSCSFFFGNAHKLGEVPAVKLGLFGQHLLLRIWAISCLAFSMLTPKAS